MKHKWNTLYSERLRKEAMDEDILECIDYAEPEVLAELLRRLQEGERAKKALERAAEYLSELTGTCPVDPALVVDQNIFEAWQNCPAEKSPDGNGCHNQTEECWLNFLLEQPESGEKKG